MAGFRIELIDPSSGDKVNAIPLTSITSLTRRQALDRYGSWEFDLAVTEKSLGVIEGKDFDVYWSDGLATHYLGRCGHLGHTINSQRTAQVRAAGSLRDLTRQTVLQRGFDGATDDVNDVLSAIVPLRSGWSLGAVDTVAKAAPMDFWYETIFDSVALLALTFNYHFREGETVKTLDFGAFGASSGVTAVGGQVEYPGPYDGSRICAIEQFEIVYQNDEVINRLIPFGGAVGVATIDLSLVDAPQPGYGVESAALPGGGSYYYIEDGASIATYGLTEVRFLRKDLRPISNSPEARTFASNVLYEAALASLLNLKDRQTVYGLSVRNLRPGAVRPGDKIRVLFRGWGNSLTGARLWLDIDADLYVLEIAETFGDGVQTRLTVSEQAMHPETTEDLLANTIRAFETAQIHVQPTISRYTVGPYTKRISTSVNAEFSFKLGPETLDIWYVKLALVGEPLKSSIETVAGSSTTTPAGGGSTTPSGGGSTTASGGGATSGDEQIHGHQWQIHDDGGASSGDPLYVKSGKVVADYGTDVNINTGASFAPHSHSTPSHSHSTPNHSHSTPDHQHTFTPNVTVNYGIFEDTVRPNSLTIKLNGSTIASGITLAGPDYDYDLDITANILAAATLQQEHTITIQAGSGRGEIQFQAQVLAVIQGIQVS